jgi:hypothetical protein
METSTFVVTSFVLRERRLDGQVFALSDSPSVQFSQLDTIVTVGFSDNDLNAIKTTEVCQSNTTCFLGFPTTLISDVSGNRIIAADQQSTFIQVDQWIRDATRPEFSNFVSISMDTGQLLLEFSESIDPSTVNASVLELHDSCCNPQVRYQVLSSSSVSVERTNMLLTLSTEDVNNIKTEPRICAQATGNDCYLRFSSSFLKDFSGNSVIAVAAASNLISSFPSTYVRDQTPPHLAEFSLEMEAGELDLTFNEPVSPLTLVASKITLFNDQVEVNLAAMATAQTDFSHSILI